MGLIKLASAKWRNVAKQLLSKGTLSEAERKIVKGLDTSHIASGGFEGVGDNLINNLSKRLYAAKTKASKDYVRNLRNDMVNQVSENRGLLSRTTNKMRQELKKGGNPIREKHKFGNLKLQLDYLKHPEMF